MSKSILLSLLVAIAIGVAALLFFKPVQTKQAAAEPEVADEQPAEALPTASLSGADVAGEGVTAEIASAIKTAIESGRPGLTIKAITRSQIDGLYKVSINNGPVLYATADGGYFVLGDLYQVKPGQFVNVAEQERSGDRVELMAVVEAADMVVFSPKSGEVKAHISVFTDVDCYYCQKLHQEVPDLNRMGIEVRYLAFPRAGIGSDSYKKIASAWCADDQQTALTRLKNRQAIEMNVCMPNPIAEQLALGRNVGVNGTPAMVTEDGQLLPGYKPALELAASLGVSVDPALAAEISQR